jgi:hypothetical protein
MQSREGFHNGKSHDFRLAPWTPSSLVGDRESPQRMRSANKGENKTRTTKVKQRTTNERTKGKKAGVRTGTWGEGKRGNAKGESILCWFSLVQSYILSSWIMYKQWYLWSSDNPKIQHILQLTKVVSDREICASAARKRMLRKASGSTSLLSVSWLNIEQLVGQQAVSKWVASRCSQVW